jgi:hypothetical protein
MSRKSDGEILKSMVGELFEYCTLGYQFGQMKKHIAILTAVEIENSVYELGSGHPHIFYKCSFFLDWGNENTKLLKETFAGLEDFKRKYRKIDARDRVRAKFYLKNGEE